MAKGLTQTDFTMEISAPVNAIRLIQGPTLPRPSLVLAGQNPDQPETPSGRFAWRLISRIVLIPVLAGFSLEYIRWTAAHLNNKFVRWLIKPNLALQSLTTREPDSSMLQVAIEAFKTMRQAEQEFAA